MGQKKDGPKGKKKKASCSSSSQKDIGGGGKLVEASGDPKELEELRMGAIRSFKKGATAKVIATDVILTLSNPPLSDSGFTGLQRDGEGNQTLPKRRHKSHGSGRALSRTGTGSERAIHDA